MFNVLLSQGLKERSLSQGSPSKCSWDGCVCVCVCVCVSLSHIQLFAASRTVAHQAPLSMELGRNTGVGNHSLLQGIFLTQRLNPGFLHLRQILSYCLSHGINPILLPFRHLPTSFSVMHFLRNTVIWLLDFQFVNFSCRFKKFTLILCFLEEVLTLYILVSWSPNLISALCGCVFYLSLTIIENFIVPWQKPFFPHSTSCTLDSVIVLLPFFLAFIAM